MMRLALPLLLGLFTSSSVFAQGTSVQPLDENTLHNEMDNDAPPRASAEPNGLGMLVGYKTVRVKQSFSHDTHPDDSFLPNATVPGSAGTTSLDRAQYISFGFRYAWPTSSRWSVNFGTTGLFAYTSGNGADVSGMNIDDRQNVNDSRPAANAAFVYTDSNWGFDVALGIRYSASESLYLGAVADFTGVWVENGWDRFGNYQAQSRKFVSIPAGGPILGLRITRSTAIEGAVLFGKNGAGYNAGLVVQF
jgi:hypothetical protein